jgi:hypothetical protein
LVMPAFREALASSATSVMWQAPRWSSGMPTTGKSISTQEADRPEHDRNGEGD